MGKSIKVDIRYPFTDIPKARQRIHGVMVDFVNATLTEWVEAGTNVIPVWSGASRASFLKLANQVGFHIVIEPLIVAPIGSRIPLGYETSTGVIIADARGSSGLYGWDYASELFYIEYVHDRTRFTEVANAAIADRRPVLPPPPVKRGKKA